MYVILKVKIDKWLSNIAILNTIKYSKIFLSASVFHMKKSVQKTITYIFIWVCRDKFWEKTNLAIFCKSHYFLFSNF